MACAAWWIALSVDARVVALFEPVGSAEGRLLAFWLPDVAFAVVGSALASWTILSGRRVGIALAWMVAGAMAYATLYCVAWAMAADSGWWMVAAMVPAAFFSLVAAADVSAELLPVFHRPPRRSTAANVLRTAIHTAIFWTVFLAVLPWAITTLEAKLGIASFTFAGQLAVAVGLFVAYSAVGLASGYTMATLGDGTPLPLDAPHALVIAGPYRFVRNPMVLAGLGQGLAVGLGLGSWGVVAYVVVGGMLWNELVRPAEEADLTVTFGEAFEDYRRRVPCWWPRRPSVDRASRR